MSLEQWLAQGQPIRHCTSRREIVDLLAMADRDLAQCELPGLSPDWKLNIAYNAALQSARAGLSACGYRPDRDAHHYRVIQSLEFTIDAPAELIGRFETYRKKRNISSYDRVGVVSEREADGMVDLARSLRRSVEEWLRREKPKLLRG